MRKKIITGMILLTIIGVIAGIYWFVEKDTQDKSGYTTPSVVEKDEVFPQLTEDQYPYIKETTYKGNENLPPVLFETPFKKTDAYVTNIQATEKMGEKGITKTRLFAEEFVRTVFDNGARDFQMRHEELKKFFENNTHKTYFETPYALYFNTGYFFERLSDLYVNSEIDISAEFKTADSLVYGDKKSFYIRGMLEFRVNSAGNDLGAVEELLHVKNITPGVKYRRIMEIRSIGWPGYQNILGYSFDL